MQKTKSEGTKFVFEYNPKIKLKVPVLKVPLEQLNAAELSEYQYEASKLAADIPAEISQLDQVYMEKYTQLQEAKEQHFFQKMNELNIISDAICELNVLYLKIQGQFLQSDRPL